MSTAPPARAPMGTSTPPMANTQASPPCSRRVTAPACTFDSSWCPLAAASPLSFALPVVSQIAFQL
eukprot:3350783-Pyramimonas_sp.AAC.1